MCNPSQSKFFYYRPQRSWAKVIFLHLSVILLTGGCTWSGPGGCTWSGPGGCTWSGPGGTWQTPPGPDTPQDQTRSPPWDQTRYPPPGPDQVPPGTRHPPGPDTPRSDTPLGPDPPGAADSGIRSTSGRYASYWNAFLFSCNFR